MSIHRTAAKRDANEPVIRQRFGHHGWHTEPRSSSGGWDIDCYPPNQQRFHLLFSTVVHVDVKMPDGKVTPAQEEKWKALREKGIPVYVVRTTEDVDALMRGELAAWEPLPPADGGYREWQHATDTRRQPRSGFTPPEHALDTMAKKLGAKRRRPRTVEFNAAMDELVPARRNYTPPRSKPVDAAKEADETFAPAPCDYIGTHHRTSCIQAGTPR